MLISADEMDLTSNKRIVMTLDAGETNLRFSVNCSGKSVTETIAMPSNGDNLNLEC